jgi:hypothetical protein
MKFILPWTIGGAYTGANVAGVLRIRGASSAGVVSGTGPFLLLKN